MRNILLIIIYIAASLLWMQWQSAGENTATTSPLGDSYTIGDAVIDEERYGRFNWQVQAMRTANL